MSDKLQRIIDSNEFLSSLLNNMTSAVFIVDKNVRVQNINKSFTKLFERPAEEVLDKLCGNAIGCVFPVKEKTDCGKTVNCDSCELRKNLLKCFRDEDKYKSYKTVVKREFFIGNEFVLKYFYVTIKYFEYENLELGLVIVFDVTELENKKLELMDLNKLKNDFLGIAAHDLRNPLTEVILSSNLLLKHSKSINDNEKKKLIEIINKSSDFMSELIDNLLDISTIESGRLDLELTENSYVEFIEECLTLNRLNAKQKNIEIEIYLDNKIPEFHFDRIKLKQVINNLIDNAIKFSPRDSKIIIRVEKDGDKLITKVVDEGPGIPEYELPKIFKEFQKISVKPTNGEKSTGLGLAIAKKIIERHNGYIGVKSKVGKGSTFYFEIPLN